MFKSSCFLQKLNSLSSDNDNLGVLPKPMTYEMSNTLLTENKDSKSDTNGLIQTKLKNDPTFMSKVSTFINK